MSTSGVPATVLPVLLLVAPSLHCLQGIRDHRLHPIAARIARRTRRILATGGSSAASCPARCKASV